MRRFHAYVGVVMVVCLGFATLLARTPRREGSMGDARLSPIAEALRQQALDEQAPQGENPALNPAAPTCPDAPTPATQPDSS